MKRRILVVDDEPDGRDMLAELLAWEGYDVCVAGNGVAGLEAARSCRIDLIITDLMMPVMDGARMLSEIKRDPELRDIPVIVVSAALGEEISKGTKHPFARKPIDIDALVVLVRRLLGR